MMEAPIAVPINDFPSKKKKIDDRIIDMAMITKDVIRKRILHFDKGIVVSLNTKYILIYGINNTKKL